MGACEFYTVASGKTAQEAFTSARDQASWESGHGGYSGTIAEKHKYVMISVPEGVEPSAYAYNLLQDGDPRIDDKWGPAGCVKLQEGKYAFFGWASS